MKEKREAMKEPIRMNLFYKTANFKNCKTGRFYNEKEKKK